MREISKEEIEIMKKGCLECHGPMTRSYLSIVEQTVNFDGTLKDSEETYLRIYWKCKNCGYIW